MSQKPYRTCISDINDHVISVATSIKYFRERRHERHKTPKIHQCRIVLKKFGQKFFQIVFLHGEVLFPTFFCFSDMYNIPAAGILRHVRHYLVKVYVWNQSVQFFNSCFMFFVANITTDFLIKNKHFRRLIDFEEHDIDYISVVYTKKSKNIKMLLDFKYFKFNFSVAGLKLQPFFQSSKWLKNGSDFCPKCRMGSRTKLLFHFFWPWSNTAHHLISHIFGKKNDYKFLHQKDHILVIRLIVKKDIRQRINVHLEKVMKTTDLEAEEICSQSEASRRQKALFFLFFSISSSRW